MPDGQTPDSASRMHAKAVYNAAPSAATVGVARGLLILGRGGEDGLSRNVAQTRIVGRLARDVSYAADASWRLRRRACQKLRTSRPGLKVLGAIVLALLIAPLAYRLLSDVITLPLWSGTEGYCGTHRLGCDLTTHLFADAVVAILVWAGFLVRQSRRSTAWRRRAKTAPDELFTWLGPVAGGLTEMAAATATERRGLLSRARRANSRWLHKPSYIIEGILGRDDLVREIADNLDSGSEPQVIVADSAAGKTMVLVKLADCLARRRQVPVAISLQGQSTLGFEALARAAYNSASPGINEEDLKKQWAELRHRGQVTVIVDDLEKVDAKPHEVAIALEQAARQKLRLVAASRPYGLPADFNEGRIELEPLHDRDVHRDLLRLMQHAPDDAVISDADAQNAVTNLVKRAEISLTPYYLSLARVLAKHGRLRTPPEGSDARLWLLHAYRNALAEGLVADGPAVALSPVRRQQVLQDLEAIAFVRVLGTRRETAIAKQLTGLRLAEVDVEDVLVAARRLGVVEARHDGQVRFAHPTTLAYFASCFLVNLSRPEMAWNLLLEKEWAPFRALTLVFATTDTDDGDRAQHVCECLLGRAAAAAESSQNGARAASPWLAVAAEIARHGRAVQAETAATVLRSVQDELDGTAQPGREQAGMLDALGTLCEKEAVPGAYDVLWKYAATRGDYSFRRRATKALIRGRDPVDALLPTIDGVMDSARRYDQELTEPTLDDRDERLDALTATAWILPSLRNVSFARSQEELPETQKANLDAQKAKLDGYQSELLDFAHRFTVQRGLEAAVAQGLKLDAVRDSSLPPDPFAIAMLGDGDLRARFWFSRVLLVQALARRCKQDHSGEALSSIADASRDKHVFVRHAAKLCMIAVVDDRPERFLFEDLTEVASRAPHGLAAETSRLIGDIVLALNLNEYGGPESRRAFGEGFQLPACLSATPNRHEILFQKSDRPACPFAGYKKEGGCLCPYTFDPPEGGTRREISRAFCRHQRLYARRVPWNSRLRAKSLRKFWADMEKLARY